MSKDIVFAKKNNTIEYWENGEKYKLTYNAELGNLSGQLPYFSITGDCYRQAKGNNRWMEDSFGCLHDEISKHFPEMKQYIKWHLVSVDSPMHYIANSLYWAGLQGWTDGKTNSPPNYEYLMSTANWGTVESDKNINLTLYMGRGNKKNIVNRIKSFLLTRILMKRQKELQKEFYRAMSELFGAGWFQTIEDFLLENAE